MTVTRFENLTMPATSATGHALADDTVRESPIDADHRPLLRAALGSTIFAFVALAVLRPRFESNDDVAMMWLADGTALGAPSPELMYSNILLGQLLSWLYTTWAAVAWYPIYLAALLWSALTAQLYLLNAARPRGALAQLSYGTLLTVNLIAWLNLQFTSAASLLSLSGVALVWFAPTTAAWPRPTGWRSRESAIGALGAVMAGLGFLVRVESFQLAVVLSVPLLMLGIGRLDRRRLVVFAVLVTLIVGTGFVAHRASRQSPEWLQYQEWNSARGLIHDTPRLLDPAAEVDALDDAGWSINDATLFKEWMFLDREIYDLASVDQVGQATAPDRDVIRILRRMASSGIAGLPVVLAAALVGLDCALHGTRRQRQLCVSIAGMSAALLSWLVVSEKIPLRIIVPMFTWFVLVGALTASSRSGASSDKRPMLGALALLLAAATVLASVLVWGPASEAETARVDRALRTLEQLDDDGIFVIWGGPIHHEFAHPFDRGSTPRMQLLWTGWMDRSPMQDEVLDRLDLADVTAAIGQRSDVHLVLTDELERPEDLMATFADEHDLGGSWVIEVENDAVRVLGCGDRCVE